MESILACISTKETARRFAIVENNADFVFQPFVTDFLCYAVVYGSTRLQQWMNAVNNSRSQQWMGFRLLFLPVYKLTTLAYASWMRMINSLITIALFTCNCIRHLDVESLRKTSITQCRNIDHHSPIASFYDCFREKEKYRARDWKSFHRIGRLISISIRVETDETISNPAHVALQKERKQSRAFLVSS